MVEAKLFTFLVLFCFCCGQDDDGLPFGYHMKVGVPKAEALLGQDDHKRMRIIGGKEVSTPSAVPYQAGLLALLTINRYSICGGALISRTRVLTAAHCWWDGQHQAKYFTVVLGSLTITRGGTRIKTSDVTIHPFWSIETKANDIGMIKIRPVQFTDNIQAISLPSIFDVCKDFTGLTASVSGYGKTSDVISRLPKTPTLYETNVMVLKNRVCQRSFYTRILESHICTSGKGFVGTCEGDSGSPLTIIDNCQRKLIGIVSFGPSVGCELGYPSVYTRVTSHLTWIKDNMEDKRKFAIINVLKNITDVFIGKV